MSLNVGCDAHTHSHPNTRALHKTAKSIQNACEWKMTMKKLIYKHSVAQNHIRTRTRILTRIRISDSHFFFNHTDAEQTNCLAMTTCDVHIYDCRFSSKWTHMMRIDFLFVNIRRFFPSIREYYWWCYYCCQKSSMQIKNAINNNNRANGLFPIFCLCVCVFRSLQPFAGLIWNCNIARKLFMKSIARFFPQFILGSVYLLLLFEKCKLKMRHIGGICKRTRCSAEQNSIHAHAACSYARVHIHGYMWYVC